MRWGECFRIPIIGVIAQKKAGAYGGEWMKVGVPKEIAEGETRVGLVPETVGKLVKDGFEVLVETGAGRNYNLDENYEEAGATIASDAGEVYGEADLIVKVA